jgi:hypothetical protein
MLCKAERIGSPVRTWRAAGLSLAILLVSLLGLLSATAAGQTGCWLETTVADFGDGTFLDTDVTGVGDGEIRLASGFQDDFSGPDGPPVHWDPWPSSSEPGHTATWTVQGGVLVHPVEGNDIGNYHPCLVDDVYTPPGDFSFTSRQRFTNTAGLGVLGVVMGVQDGETYHFIQWVPTQGAVKLYRRAGASWTLVQQTAAADPVLDQWYELRLETVGTTINFYIDDVPALTASDAAYMPGRLGLMTYMGSVNEYDDVVLTGDLLFDSGTYESDAHDLGAYNDFLTLSWLGSAPTPATVDFETRSSEDGVAWSPWAAVDGPGNIASPAGQHLQYRISLATSDPGALPVVEQVELCYEAAIPADCWLQTSVADFAGCGLDQVAVTEDDGSGELRLVPAFHDIFGGTVLDPQWESSGWGGGAYAPTVADGIMTHFNPGSGAYVRTPAEHGLGTSVAGLLKFDRGGNATAGYLYFGFAGEGLVPWALFGTGYEGDSVYASLYDGAGPYVADLGADLLDAWHHYEIVRTAAGAFEWYVDGELRHTNDTHAIPPDPLRIYFSVSGGTPAGAAVAADWVRVDGYAVSPGIYTSCVFNSGQTSDWLTLAWTGSAPPGTGVGFATRSGDTLTPDGTWSPWEALSGTDIVSPDANFIQCRAELSTTDAAVSPVVEEVEICYGEVGPDMIPPEVVDVSPPALAQEVPVDGNVTATFSESLDPATVTAGTFTLTPEGGVPVAATVHYDDGNWTATLVPDADLAYDTIFEARLGTGVQDLAGNPLAGDYVWSFSTAAERFCWQESSEAEFADGDLTDSEVVACGDGAFRIVAETSFFDHFAGTAAGPEWELHNFFGNPPEVTVTGSVVTAQDGNCIKTYATYDHVTLEGLVTLQDGANAHFGLGTAVDAASEGVPDPHWMMFTARNGGFEARTRMSDGLGDVAGQIDEPLAGYAPGQPYRLKIVWLSDDTVEFYVDGTQVASHTRSFGADQMKIYLTSNTGQDGSADWVSLSGGHAAGGTYVSSVYDAGGPAIWLDLAWAGHAPAATGAAFETRTGDIAVPDASWSAWAAVTGGSIASPDGRYAQYRGALSTSDAAASPLVEMVRLCYEAGECAGIPAAVSDLAAEQVLTGNDPGQTTAIRVSWSAVPAGRTVNLYRKGYGNHPEYDDMPDAGAEPAAPVDPDDALAQGWLPAGAYTGTEALDRPTGRDFWYYVAFVSDACDNVSPVSNRTAGTLDYHLGDVYDGVTHGQGDNLVGIDDITELGAGYGTVAGHPDYRNYLDVGPTHDMSTGGRPTTDDAVQFEDLMLFALNYGHVGKDEPPAPAATNRLALLAPALPAVGESFEVSLRMAGDGLIQGLSVPVLWDAQVVAYQGLATGGLLAAQGGEHILLSPAAGRADAALLGVRPLGICGEGVLATLSFRVLTDGNPAFDLGEIAARSAQNAPVPLVGEMTGVVPSVTRLYANAPNPFNPRTTLKFDLAQAGHVNLTIYALDGRRVRRLLDGEFPAGRFSAIWDGRTDRGRQVASGVYLYRLVAPGMTQTKRMMLLK